MVFEHQEKFMHVKLTNTTVKNGQTRPIMFKIKTNKIDLVDAKPSCGYISGKPGHNEISVTIRWLNNTNDHSAKLQILYVENNRITEEMVERNSAHFDNDQYNQNYQAIKNQNQNQAKTLILPVVRKLPHFKPEPIPKKDQLQEKKQQLIPKKPLVNPPIGKDPKEIIIQPPVDSGDQKRSSGISLAKCLTLVLAAFLIGLLAGFSLGKAQLKQASLPRTIQQSKPEESESLQKNPTPETVEVQEPAPVTIEETNTEPGQSDDLSEFVGEETNPKTPQNEPVPTESEQIPEESNPSSEQPQQATAQQTL